MKPFLLSVIYFLLQLLNCPQKFPRAKHPHLLLGKIKIIYGISPVYHWLRQRSLVCILFCPQCVCVYHSCSSILFCMCKGGNSGLLQCGSLVLCRHKKSTPSPAQTECVWISNLKLKGKEILHENITMCVNYILLILSFLNMSVFWGTYPSSRV